MKNVLAILFLFFCASTRAQTTKAFDVIMNADSTYQLRQMEMQEGDSTPFLVHLFPETGGLPAQDFVQWLYNRTRSLERQEQEHKMIRRNLKQVKDISVSLLDTLAGAGTYEATVNAEVLQSLQGTWMLIKRPPNADPTKKVVSISGNTLTSGAKTGTITVTATDAFTLAGYIVADLNFTLRQNGKWVAKKGQTVFILRK
jgi:hypothetical protein